MVFEFVIVYKGTVILIETDKFEFYVMSEFNRIAEVISSLVWKLKNYLS